jgi:hypothetical protein
MKSLPDLERIQIRADLKWAQYREKLNERLLGSRIKLMQQQPQPSPQEGEEQEDYGR